MLEEDYKKHASERDKQIFKCVENKEIGILSAVESSCFDTLEEFLDEYYKCGFSHTFSQLDTSSEVIKNLAYKIRTDTLCNVKEKYKLLFVDRSSLAVLAKCNRLADLRSIGLRMSFAESMKFELVLKDTIVNKAMILDFMLYNECFATDMSYTYLHVLFSNLAQESKMFLSNRLVEYSVSDVIQSLSKASYKRKYMIISEDIDLGRRLKLYDFNKLSEQSHTVITVLDYYALYNEMFPDDQYNIESIREKLQSI